MVKNKTNKQHMPKTSICQTMTQEQLTVAIAKKAQELYEKSGKKSGKDLNNWLEAERLVKASLCSDLTRMQC
jgi:hypothetical protein